LKFENFVMAVKILCLLGAPNRCSISP